MDKNLKIIESNLRLLDRFFEEYSQYFEWNRPVAGCTGFVKFKGLLSGDVLAQQLENEGILVFAPSVFDCSDDLEQYFRIGFSRTTMPAALEAEVGQCRENRRECESAAFPLTGVRHFPSW